VRAGPKAVRAAVLWRSRRGACDISRLRSAWKKLKDTGYGGPCRWQRSVRLTPQWYPEMRVAPANFAQLATAYRSKNTVCRRRVNVETRHRPMSRSRVTPMASKNPKAHLRKTLTEEQVVECPDHR